MATFVQLTHRTSLGDGGDLWVNLDHVLQMRRVGDGNGHERTEIAFADGQCTYVVESPEFIANEAALAAHPLASVR